MTPSCRAARAALVLLALLGAASSAEAQQFGKNPMRTNPEFADLKMVSSGQVDVIYYAPLDTLARLALPIADSCIVAMEANYDHELIPQERVTVFLFGENEEYRQGWVLPGYLTPPSIGYTEPLKGTIGVSFDGDAANGASGAFEAPPRLPGQQTRQAIHPARSSPHSCQSHHIAEKGGICNRP